MFTIRIEGIEVETASASHAAQLLVEMGRVKQTDVQPVFELEPKGPKTNGAATPNLFRSKPTIARNFGLHPGTGKFLEILSGLDKGQKMKSKALRLAVGAKNLGAVISSVAWVAKGSNITTEEIYVRTSKLEYGPGPRIAEALELVKAKEKEKSRSVR